MSDDSIIFMFALLFSAGILFALVFWVFPTIEAEQQDIVEIKEPQNIDIPDITYNTSNHGDEYVREELPGDLLDIEDIGELLKT